jgi:protein-tyrosine phosphatase
VGETGAAIAGLLNFRDVGGLPVRGGGRIAFGRLYRSYSLSGLGPAGMAGVRALGLSAVLDLRDEYELEHWPYDLGDPAIARIHTPVLGDLGAPADQLGLYRHMIETCGPGVTGAVRVIARTEALPVLVHCAVGKDRTGVTVGLALTAVGVPDEAVIGDFLLSNPGLNIETPADDVDIPYDGYQTHRYVRAVHMETALEHARRLGGDVPGFLAMHGMTDAELDGLRVGLVEPDVG